MAVSGGAGGASSWTVSPPDAGEAAGAEILALDLAAHEIGFEGRSRFGAIAHDGGRHGVEVSGQAEGFADPQALAGLAPGIHAAQRAMDRGHRADHEC